MTTTTPANTTQAKTQPAPYRRITDHTTAILMQIITQLHPTADPNQAELICHTPGGTSGTHLVSCRILNWLTPAQPVSDYTYRLRQLTGCAYHFLPYGWKTHYAHHLGLYPARLRRWMTHTPHLIPDNLIAAPTDPIIDGLPNSMWQDLDNLGTPIPKTLLTPEVKRLVVVACKTQTRFPAREFAHQLGISRRMLESWEAALADGSITALACPRRIGTLTTAQAQEIIHMQQQHRDKDRYITELEHQLSQARIERDRLSKAVDALGKAIKTMPDPCEDLGEDNPT